PVTALITERPVEGFSWPAGDVNRGLKPGLSLRGHACGSLTGDRPRRRDHPARIEKCAEDGFPTGGRLAREDHHRDAVRLDDPASFTEGLAQFAFIERDVLLRRAQLVLSVDDNLFFLIDALATEEVGIARTNGPTQPHVEE